MDKRDSELFTTKLRINSKGYVVCQEKLLHRVIMNAKEGEVVDHIIRRCKGGQQISDKVLR